MSLIAADANRLRRRRALRPQAKVRGLVSDRPFALLRMQIAGHRSGTTATAGNASVRQPPQSMIAPSEALLLL